MMMTIWRRWAQAMRLTTAPLGRLAGWLDTAAWVASWLATSVLAGVLVTALLTALARVAHAAAPAACGVPVCVLASCVQACPAPAPKAKPSPKPCPITPAGAIGAMREIPEPARALILESASLGAHSARVTVVGGRMIMDNSGELTALRGVDGLPVAPASGAGSVYRADGHYVVRWDGCHAWAIATGPVAAPWPVTAPVGPQVDTGPWWEGWRQPGPMTGPVKAAPEPASWVLVLVALAGVWLVRRRC